MLESGCLHSNALIIPSVNNGLKIPAKIKLHLLATSVSSFGTTYIMKYNGMLQ